MDNLTRRDFLSILGAGAGAATTGAALRRRDAGKRLAELASSLDVSSAGGLGEIDHIVIVMQENRSFDHYFGVMSGVRGFSDPHVRHEDVAGRRLPVFDQFGYEPRIGVTDEGFLQPFRLRSAPPTRDGQTTNDITHSWGPQHESWHEGRMTDFVRSHVAADGAANGPVTMGYFTRADLPFYYALADAFTICDGYHCSVLGPTDPNRLMWISATIDPDGRAGGPVLETFTDRQAYYGSLSWQTMPERLTEAGVSWKVYNDPTSLLELSPFPYFRQFAEPSSPTEVHNAALACGQVYPAGFAADVASGSLPQVSWIMSPLAECEHPAAPPEYGEYLVSEILSTLVSNPEVWGRTALFVVYDENGGFFDHVAPPTAPRGTPGEWLTVSPLPASASGVDGPIGLGFRVPCLVISPYSRGGWVCSQTFDHTSLLRLVETRFSVEVPNLSAWRRHAVGDLSRALPLVTARTQVPTLPATSLGDTTVAEQAVINALAGTADEGQPYPLPTENRMPTQEFRPLRHRVP